MEKREIEKVRYVEGWRCEFCGEIYATKEEAEMCWDRHIRFEMQPVFSMQEEFPVEVLVKKIEGNYYTEIATYELKKKEKVLIERQGGNEDVYGSGT
jgi:hypothetical protein